MIVVVQSKDSAVTSDRFSHVDLRPIKNGWEIVGIDTPAFGREWTLGTYEDRNVAESVYEAFINSWGHEDYVFRMPAADAPIEDLFGKKKNSRFLEDFAK